MTTHDDAPADGSVGRPVPGTTDDRVPAGLPWVWQAVSGILVLVLVTIHMIANHFVVRRGLRNYHDVVAYIGNPVILTLELLFLVVVSLHGLLGLRSVIFDFGLSRTAERRVTVLLALVWVATVVYGIWLIATVVSRP